MPPTPSYRQMFNNVSLAAPQAQPLKLEIPNTAPAALLPQTLELKTGQGMSAQTIPGNLYNNADFKTTIEEAKSLSAIAAEHLKRLEQNPGIIHAQEALTILNTPGVPPNGRKHLKEDIAQTLGDPDLKSDFIQLQREMGSAEVKWLNSFAAVEDDPKKAVTAKEAFEQHYLDKFESSGLPVDDGHGGFGTVGQAVQEWAKPELELLDEVIKNAAKMQAQAPRNNQAMAPS